MMLTYIHLRLIPLLWLDVEGALMLQNLASYFN